MQSYVVACRVRTVYTEENESELGAVAYKDNSMCRNRLESDVFVHEKQTVAFLAKGKTHWSVEKLQRCDGLSNVTYNDRSIVDTP